MKNADKDLEKVVNLWNMLWPVKKIAEDLNCPVYKVNALLKKARQIGYRVLTIEEKNEKRKELAVQMWNEGKSKREIGEELFITSSKVSELLSNAEKNGNELRKPKTINQDIIVQMWNEGRSQQDIADKLDTHVDTVFDYLMEAKDAGIELRNIPKSKEKIDRYKKFLELRKLGMDTKEIASQLGISKKRIGFYEKRSETEKQRTILDKLLDMWDEQCNPQEIVKAISNDIIANADQKHNSKRMVIELLKSMLPQDVAEKLNISIEEVYSIIHSVGENELWSVKKEFLKSKKDIYNFIKQEKNKGMSLSQAFENYEEKYARTNFTDLSEIYLVLGLKDRSIDVLNKIIFNRNIDVDIKDRAMIQKGRIRREISVQNMKKKDKDYSDLEE